MATSIEVTVEEMERSQVTCIPFAVLVPPATSFVTISNNDIGDDDDNDDDDFDDSDLKLKPKKKLQQQPTQTTTTKITKDPMMIDSTTDLSSFLQSSLDYGVVGTILFLGPKSVLIWFGWGQIDQHQKRNQQNTTTTTKDNDNSFSVIPSTKNCSMGPLLVSMPQHNNSNNPSISASAAFTNNYYNNTIGTTSKLIGGSSTHTEMILQQMSSRLSSKLNISILVSCSFDSDDNYRTSSSIAANNDNGSTAIGGTSILDDSYEMTTSRAAAFTEKEIYRILYSKIYATTNEQQQ